MVPPPLPLSLLLIIRLSNILLRLIIIIVSIIIILMFGKGVLQPIQALLADLQGCITNHIEYNRGVGGRITTQAETSRAGGVYYNTNRV